MSFSYILHFFFNFIANIIKTTRSEFILRIPNEEVKLCFEQKITSFFEDSPSFLNSIEIISKTEV